MKSRSFPLVEAAGATPAAAFGARRRIVVGGVALAVLAPRLYAASPGPSGRPGGEPSRPVVKVTPPPSGSGPSMIAPGGAEGGNFGSIEMVLTLGGQPLASSLLLELRQAGAWIAAAVAKREQPVRFQARPGRYELHVPLPSGQPLVINGIDIQAGQAVKRTLALPLADLTVEVTVPPFAPGQLPRPNVVVRQNDVLFADAADNPARFLLPPGIYAIGAEQSAASVYARTVQIQLTAGDVQKVTLNQPA